MARMRLFAIIFVLCYASIASSGGNKDEKSIDGTWIPSSAELAGKKFPDEIRKAMKLVVKENKYTVSIGPQKDEGTVKLNPTEKPKTIDIVGTAGPNKDKTILAIYEIENEKLRICYDLSGKDRPTEFKTAIDTQQFLVTYDREKQ